MDLTVLNLAPIKTEGAMSGPLPSSDNTGEVDVNLQ